MRIAQEEVSEKGIVCSLLFTYDTYMMGTSSNHPRVVLMGEAPLMTYIRIMGVVLPELWEYLHLSKEQVGYGGNCVKDHVITLRTFGSIYVPSYLPETMEDWFQKKRVTDSHIIRLRNSN